MSTQPIFSARIVNVDGKLNLMSALDVILRLSNLHFDSEQKNLALRLPTYLPSKIYGLER